MDDGSPTIILFIIIGLLTAIILYLLYIIKSSSKKLDLTPPAFHDEDEVTDEQIISVVNESHEQGNIMASEVEMINNILEFDEKEAKDIMTHRMNMNTLDGEMSYVDALSFVIEKGKSRFPVYLEDLDHIIGVLHIKDMLSFAQHNELFRTSIKDIDGLIREVDVVPETLNINELFKEMQKDKTHMVMVVDEYGQISGLVALEDILEEIVGNIEDEHDNEEDEAMIHKEAEGDFVIEGLASFAEVCEIIDLPLEPDEFETLNGFIITLMDRLPQDGEQVSINKYGYNFKVLEASDNIIRQVRITRDVSGEGTLAPESK